MPRVDSFRPFDKRNSQQCVVPAEFEDFSGGFQAVEVEMGQRAFRCVIRLDQGEGWARNFEVRFACKGADEGAGEDGLAAAEGSAQQNSLAGAQQGGQFGRKAGGGLFGIGLNLNGKLHGEHYITLRRLWLWGPEIGKIEG